MARNKYRLGPDGRNQFDARTRAELREADRFSPDPMLARAQKSRAQKQKAARIEEVKAAEKKTKRAARMKKVGKALESAAQSDTLNQPADPFEEHDAAVAAGRARQQAATKSTPGLAQQIIKRRRV